jgi:NADH-quinone oxidoreductase subunit E
MARLTPENVQRARDLIALYPRPRSALIPILHVLQEQDGYLTEDGMTHVAELLSLTPAEVLGTASFYDMFFTHPVGRHLVSICTNVACLLNGGYELLEHAEAKLGVKAGGTTADKQFTLEEVECIALCGEAPCLAVNWRFFGNVTNESFDRLVDDLRSGRLSDTVPPHGTLSRVRRTVGLTATVERPAPAHTEAAAPTEASTSMEKPPGSQPETQADVDKGAKDVAEVRAEGDTASEENTGERA